ncbi:uncharacterized protein BDZ99DRAFT_468885 [Mytilinidion resinicola]|uniref:Uncharacterized protein n=1 Tax=Mytilinidion resinicola TaxID=574789 RepID=A0A6A6Y327_9PEZI|nr:uncharacterized protein BDZ99DRAFT_468885 [Mytilinidion resinicola]KAF2802414.1 hypothetical protein BDZ99DRAFT_468885 [Mytilinidion resinicola]
MLLSTVAAASRRVSVSSRTGWTDRSLPSAAAKTHLPFIVTISSHPHSHTPANPHDGRCYSRRNVAPMFRRARPRSPMYRRGWLPRFHFPVLLSRPASRDCWSQPLREGAARSKPAGKVSVRGDRGCCFRGGFAPVLGDFALSDSGGGIAMWACVDFWELPAPGARMWVGLCQRMCCEIVGAQLIQPANAAAWF